MIYIYIYIYIIYIDIHINRLYIYLYIYIIYIYIYLYIPTLYAFVKMSHTKIKQKDLHKIPVIFRLLTNLLRTNLSKKCKIVYAIRIVIK